MNRLFCLGVVLSLIGCPAVRRDEGPAPLKSVASSNVPTDKERVVPTPEPIQVTKPLPARSAGEAAGLVFALSTPKNQYMDGESIPLTLTLRNTRDFQIRIPGGLYANADEVPPSLMSGIQVICQSRHNGGPILPFKGNFFKSFSVGREVRSGETFTAIKGLDLTQCFDLNPGQYDIQILFHNRYSGFINAASNRISLTIVKQAP